MNKQEASRILHPDTTAQAMAGYLLDDPSGDTWAQALNKACEMGAEALRSPWVKTADRLPTEADANKESKVLGWIRGYGYRGADYKFVIVRPEHVTWWMPFPSRLEEVRHDNS